MPLLGATLGCHCWVPLLGAIAGVPLLGAIARKIDQSVTPFSAAPFSTLITQKLASGVYAGIISYLLQKACYLR